MRIYRFCIRQKLRKLLTTGTIIFCEECFWLTVNWNLVTSYSNSNGNSMEWLLHKNIRRIKAKELICLFIDITIHKKVTFVWKPIFFLNHHHILPEQNPVSFFSKKLVIIAFSQASVIYFLKKSSL